MKALFKKYGFILLGLALGMLIFLPGQARAAIPAFEEATVTAQDVNMRLRPDTNSPIVLKLAKGSRIGVFDEEVEGWYRIIYGNYRGYISKEYVFLPSVDSIVGNALSDGVQLKQYPMDFSSNIATLTAGEGITIRNFEGDWYYAQTSAGVLGYVKQDQIKQSTAKTAATFIKKGMKGVEVVKMQKSLKERGFFSGSLTGNFGDETEAAIILFQKAANISPDGVAGAKTLELLYGDNDIKTTLAKKYGITNKVELSEWDEIKNVVKKGTKFKITDVKTGISFNAWRFGGWYHADSEPLTKEDTANYKKIYGGTWSWDRRAVWVTVGNHTYAASIHGMPHMADVTKDNDFPGHFCVHFNGSKVHETEKECPRHQACVRYAYNKGQEV